MVLPDTLKEIAQEADKNHKKTKRIPIKKDSLPLFELKKAFKKRRYEEILLLLKEWESNGKIGKKPSALSPLHCSYVLQEYITFCLFDEEENARLAFYVSEEGIYTQNEDRIRRIISWLEPTLNKNKAGDVLYYLKNAAEIREKTNLRFLIPVKNGVFNLETKELESFSPERVFTSKIATPYVKNVPNPTIEGWNVDEWLKGLANGEEDLYTLLWQVISACMNGNYSRRKSIWLYGEGNTGKGTFQQLIMNLVGVDNVATLKLPQFSERFALPMLEEKVCCIGDDVPANVYIDDSSNFNSVVTGDRIMIEQKNKPAYSANFNMTILQSTNGMPKIHNKSEGTYRRFLIIQFKTKYIKGTDNWSIKNDYIHRKEVLEYVLSKAIQLDFEQFIVPKSSELLLEDYKIENDPIRDFKETVFDEFTSTRIPVYLLYQYYVDFCEMNRYKIMTTRNFISNFEKLLDNDWEKKSAKVGNFFKERYLPLQLDKNPAIEKLDENKAYTCFVNTRIELVS